MRILIILVIFLNVQYLIGQTTIGLVAYYPFEGNLEDVTGNTANNGVPGGAPGYNCGVIDNALALDGVDDFVSFLGNVNDEFDTEDFTVSFYFKPNGLNGTQYLLSKWNDDCSTENSFFIRYVPVTKTMNIVLQEDNNNRVSIIYRLPAGRCWYHVTLVRDEAKVQLYINGEFITEQGTLGRVDLFNGGDLVFGGSRCLGPNEISFDGFLDDFRVYNRALNEEEATELYIAPDNIVNEDALIFLGESVPIEMSKTCGTSFLWMPEEGVSSTSIQNPIITPVAPGVQTYNVQISDAFSSCVAEDSIRITVVDPNKLDCRSVYLPKAFTPNGDGINDDYGISNPFAISNLIAFEIFDRWGNRVFDTTSPFDRWDGSYRGTAVNPGVMLYRITHVCNGQEILSTGSLTILR